MVCPNCGQPVSGGFFCSNCGAKLDQAGTAGTAVQIEAPVTQAHVAEPAPAAQAVPEITQAPVAASTPVADQAPVAQAVPVTQPVPVAAPAVQPAPVAPAAPAAQPAPAVQATPVTQAAPAAQPAPQAPSAQDKPAKKKSAKPFIIIGAIVLGIILLVGAGVGVFFFLTSSIYNEGLEAIENEDYENAYDTFTGLKDFKDSEYWAEYARLELDYQGFDSLVETDDFDGIIAMLEERSDFFGKDEKGKDAKALLEEYKTVKSAFEAKDSGNYSEAAEQFDSLVLLNERFGYEANLCRAHDYVEDHEWMDAVVDLYGLQIGDLDLEYMDNPQDADQRCISSKHDEFGNYVDDPQAIEDILKPEGEEASELADTAVKGLWYNYGYTKWMNYEFEEAIEVFKKISDFPEADYMLGVAQSDLDEYMSKYEEAVKYFENGEYYKAKKGFESIPTYKDASERALECTQPLPDTGDYKVDDGSIELNIYAPDNRPAVFIRLYDSDGDPVAQVFIRSGESETIYVGDGTYTIKVAYGKDWYGLTDMFGDSGTYTQLYNGSDPEFTFNYGYWYDLELYTSSGGNVGSDTLSGAGDM